MPFDVYAYFDACRELGMSSSEALRNFQRDVSEYEHDLVEELEERQDRYAYQQDIIDLYRRER